MTAVCKEMILNWVQALSRTQLQSWGLSDSGPPGSRIEEREEGREKKGDNEENTCDFILESSDCSQPWDLFSSLFLI